MYTRLQAHSIIQWSMPIHNQFALPYTLSRASFGADLMYVSTAASAIKQLERFLFMVHLESLESTQAIAAIVARATLTLLDGDTRLNMNQLLNRTLAKSIKGRENYL